MSGSWIGLLIALIAVVPAVIAVLLLNRRQQPPVRGDHNDPANFEDPRFDGMNKQGLGWGTRDNDRGGL